MPLAILVLIAVVAPLNNPDSPRGLPIVVRPRFDPWIFDSTNYDGQFHLCSVAPVLQCAIAFVDEP